MLKYKCSGVESVCGEHFENVPKALWCSEVFNTVEHQMFHLFTEREYTFHTRKHLNINPSTAKQYYSRCFLFY